MGNDRRASARSRGGWIAIAALAAAACTSFKVADDPHGFDAVPAADARVASVVQAEAADEIDSLDGGSTLWRIETFVPGFHGTAFMYAADAGAECPDTPPQAFACGAHLRIPVRASVAGDYRIWLRTSATSSESDEVYVGYDGAYVGVVNVPQDGAWNWDKALDAVALDETTHLVDLWMFEDGLRVDEIAVIADDGPP
jgi:hypothetical protein